MFWNRIGQRGQDKDRMDEWLRMNRWEGRDEGERE